VPKSIIVDLEDEDEDRVGVVLPVDGGKPASRHSKAGIVIDAGDEGLSADLLRGDRTLSVDFVLSVIIAAGSIALLKVALIFCLTGTFVARFSGSVEVTVGGWCR
jgi:hypothetical protein